MSSNPVSTGITGYGKSPTITYITELPPSKRRELCEHCDQIDVWMQMATKMGFSENDIETIKRRIRIPGNSPTGELLKIWGGQYNHKIVELFGVFHKLKIFNGMRIIKDYVPPEYKLLIPISIPRISKMLQTNPSNNENSVKIPNGPTPTSSGVETTNMPTMVTTDDNNTSSSSNNNYDRSRSALHPSRQLTNSSMPNLQDITSIMPEIDYQELTEATSNWDQKLVLGKGGFGTVFRGYWKHTDVAIKQIDYRGAGGREGAKVQLQQSLNELKHLHKYRHDNILPLYGYCIKGDKPCLVYQLMKGGSLEQRLNTNKFQPLTWQQRIDICMGTARATRCSICVCNSRYNLIGRIAKSLGFKVVKENKRWNILWTDSLPGVEIYKNMKRFQQINHFPGMMEICRKDLLSRNLNRMLKLYPKDYKIFPKTWIFPADYGEALNYANNHNKQKMFIIKPDAGAQGRGIWLTSDLKNVSTTERMICQTYISKPLLIDGYKFDLRVYALITSVDPLRIFVYNEGLARLATNKYVEPSMDNSDNLYMHLTNYSVNKRNSQYELCDNDDCGSKRNFGAINSWMRRQNYDVKGFWDRIDDIIVKTILSAWPILKHNYHACFPSHDKIQACFEILGFDILVDSKMKPYVLEVNHSPSFHTNELVDLQVKRPLIRDTLSLIGTVLADKRQILREDRKRIKQRLLKTKPGSLSQSYNVTNINKLADKSLSNTTIECPVSAIAQQIAWEESHLGDYRRIMPPNDPHKLNYYCQFYGQLNKSSIFADTASSKKREEVSKKLRKDLEEKKQKQTEMFKRKVGAIEFEERQRRIFSIPRIIAEKQRQELMRSQANWAPDFISAAEERLRVTYMQMRAEILKELKVTEMIYTMLYNAGSLTKADIVKFPHLYRSLEGGIKI